ncbi:hypothetical protein Hanom_Chr14g01249651 [Helianthus anomalus]
MVDHSVTAEELQSVEYLLQLAPSHTKEQPHTVSTTIKAHKGRNPTSKRKPNPIPAEEQPPPAKQKSVTKQKPNTKDKGNRPNVEPKGLNDLMLKSIESAKIRNEKKYSEHGNAFRSPYYNRMVNLAEPLLDREMIVLKYTFATFAKKK